MKVSAQMKIAELESRIAALEKAIKISASATQYVTTPFEPRIREHWNAMWNEFNIIMKQVFK